MRSALWAASLCAMVGAAFAAGAGTQATVKCSETTNWAEFADFLTAAGFQDYEQLHFVKSIEAMQANAPFTDVAYTEKSIDLIYENLLDWHDPPVEIESVQTQHFTAEDIPETGIDAMWVCGFAISSGAERLLGDMYHFGITDTKHQELAEKYYRMSLIQRHAVHVSREAMVEGHHLHDLLDSFKRHRAQCTADACQNGDKACCVPKN